MIIRLLAFIIKMAIVYCLVIFGMGFYDKNLPLYIQNPIVWILVYLPVAMGYESLVNVLFSNKKYEK